MTVTGQPTENYTWDNANRLTSVTQGSASVALGYDAANRRTTLTLPNGIVAAYTYDADSHPTGLSYSSNGTQIGNLTYTYDAAGRIMEKSGGLVLNNLPQPRANTFNAANQMTAFGGSVLSYDANGNLAGDGTNTYTWDARDRLIAISGANIGSFVYDPLGRRVQKTINGVATKFLYDGSNTVQEIQNNAVSANLLNGLGIDQLFQRTDSAGARSFLTDNLGSTLALTDAAGNVQTQYSYDPFGSAATIGQTSSNTLQFAGRDNDGTGLYFYRARYYSSTLQRFISQDPTGFGGGDTNLYGYVLENPTSLIDPFGLRPLSDCEKSALSKYIPKEYLANADLHDDGVPWFTPPWKAGITLHNDIYFRPGVYDPTKVGDIALLAHELVHVGQYEYLGLNYFNYFLDVSGWERPAEGMFALVSSELGAKGGTGCSTQPSEPKQCH